MRALLAQLEPTIADPERNAARLAEAVAAHDDADLAVFPELYLCGYDPEAADALACRVDSPALEMVARAARETATAIVIGFAERAESGAVANSVACFERDGRVAAVYRKTHLFGPAEHRAFVAGDAIVVCDLAGVQVAPLICFDIEFPEPARAAARAGAGLLVTPSANMAPYGPDHELLSRARALENRIAHLYVNRVGHEAGLDFVGGSRAVGPDGQVIAEAGTGEGLLACEIDLETANGDDVDYLRHARGPLPVDVMHIKEGAQG